MTGLVPKNKELTDRQLEVVELLTTDALKPSEIATRLDVSASVVYRILARDDVRAEVLRRSRATLAMHTPSAVRTLVRLASGTGKSELVQLEASKALLDRVGITEPQENNVLAIQINLDT